MFTRVVVLGLCVLAGGVAQADVIAITNPDFTADLTGWTVQVTPIGDAFWKWADGTGSLPEPSAELDIGDSNKTSLLFQTFASTGVIPGQVINANLSWNMYALASNPVAWGADQYLRVQLADESATSLQVFTTVGRPPQYGDLGVGAPATQDDTSDLIDFLNQLALGEEITLTFEAFTSGFMLAAVDDIVFNFDLAPQAVPEPSSMLLGGFGLGALVVARRRRRTATLYRSAQ